MKKFKSYNVGRNLNLRLDINKIIDEDHLCRKIEKIVSTLDTKEIESKYSSIGQHALHPKMMLSIIFYGYASGVRSGRNLAVSCQENLAYVYLSKGHNPKKTAINEFRRKHYSHFHDLFLQVLKLAKDYGLGDFSLAIGDGSKIEANSSKRRTKNKDQYTKWKKRLEADIEEIKQEIEIKQENLEHNARLKKN